MSNFLLISIVGSLVLTIILNLLPLLFPDATAKIRRKIQESAKRAVDQRQHEDQPSVQVFFPWKLMILVSVVLTVLINLFVNLSQ